MQIGSARAQVVTGGGGAGGGVRGRMVGKRHMASPGARAYNGDIDYFSM